VSPSPALPPSLAFSRSLFLSTSSSFLKEFLLPDCRLCCLLFALFYLFHFFSPFPADCLSLLYIKLPFSLPELFHLTPPFTPSRLLLPHRKKLLDLCLPSVLRSVFIQTSWLTSYTMQLQVAFNQPLPSTCIKPVRERPVFREICRLAQHQFSPWTLSG